MTRGISHIRARLAGLRAFRGLPGLRPRAADRDPVPPGPVPPGTASRSPVRWPARSPQPVPSPRRDCPVPRSRTPRRFHAAARPASRMAPVPPSIPGRPAVPPRPRPCRPPRSRSPGAVSRPGCLRSGSALGLRGLPVTPGGQPSSRPGLAGIGPGRRRAGPAPVRPPPHSRPGRSVLLRPGSRRCPGSRRLRPGSRRPARTARRPRSRPARHQPGPGPLAPSARLLVHSPARSASSSTDQVWVAVASAAGSLTASSG